MKDNFNLIEGRYSEIPELLKLRESNSNIKLVGAGNYYPANYGKETFDLFEPDLAPTKFLLERLKRSRIRFLNMASGMRSWGVTTEDREFVSECKAFASTFGGSGIIYIRHLSRSKKALEAISKIREMVENKYIVYLLTHEEYITGYRSILLKHLLGDKKLYTLFKRRKYSKYYMAFAKHVEGLYMAKTGRII